MNKFKKQLKDFRSYFLLLKYGVNASNKLEYRKFFPLLVAVVVCVMLILGQMSSSGDTIMLNTFMPFLCGMAIATGITTSYRPSLIGVAPFTPKQRIVFSYIATILRGILLTLLWAAIMIAVMLFMAFTVFIFTGENTLVFERGDYTPISAYGEAHSALTWIILIFASYAISHLDSRKARIISTVCFFVVAEILVLILVNLCGFAEQWHEIETGANDGLVMEYFIFSDVSRTIDYLAYPWAVIIVEGALALAAFAASLYTSVMRYKSSKI